MKIKYSSNTFLSTPTSLCEITSFLMLYTWYNEDIFHLITTKFLPIFHVIQLLRSALVIFIVFSYPLIFTLRISTPIFRKEKKKFFRTIMLDFFRNGVLKEVEKKMSVGFVTSLDSNEIFLSNVKKRTVV